MEPILDGHWHLVPVARTPPPVASTVFLGDPASDPLILLHQDALTCVKRHLRRDTSREHGGLLLGNAHQIDEERMTVTAIHKACPCPDAPGSIDHFTIDQACWDKVHCDLSQASPRMRIVGWFHSHPGMPVRPSQRDAFIQRHFFSEEWQVAWICDPIADRHAFFAVSGCSLRDFPNVAVFAESSHVAD